MYEWAAPGVEPQIDVPELQHIDMIADGYGRWISELSAGRSLSGDVEEFPASELPLLQMQGILSIVLQPIFSGERWWGLFGFDACDARKTWSKAETDALRIAAESLGGAMNNQALANQMRRRVDLLTETVIELDEGCRIRFVNPAWRALVGLEPAAVVGRSLTDFVQPEYRLAVEARHRIAGKNPGTRRILLVEDNQFNQLVASHVLGKLGHRVEVAANGRIAVATCAREDFDLILMDCHMPEMDGFEATRTIRARQQPGQTRVPIVAMTADAIAGTRQACLDAGMDDYVAKPVTKDALEALIERWTRARLDQPK